jgi:hypothetical protein
MAARPFSGNCRIEREKSLFLVLGSIAVEEVVSQCITIGEGRVPAEMMADH